MPRALFRDGLHVTADGYWTEPKLPPMRRDANNLVLALDRAEALQLVAVIGEAFGGDSFEKVLVHIEFGTDGFRAQDVFE